MSLKITPTPQNVSLLAPLCRQVVPYLKMLAWLCHESPRFAVRLFLAVIILLPSHPAVKRIHLAAIKALSG